MATLQFEGLISSLVLVCLMVLGLYLVDRRWKRAQRELEKASGIMTQSQAFALNLVRHFMPSWKVQKYQFRGMRMKEKSVHIAFSDLSLELPSGAKVLNSVSGEFPGGRMCAIMGASGAGKTTFMNVLCAKATYGKMGGCIKINGEDCCVDSINSVVGFVPQDDVVDEILTVREQIRFSAFLRNDPRIPRKRVDYITEDVLNVMQIDHIQNSIVGGVEQRGISGGQRKRVNIGLELAAQPSLLFLDEPTSGLDSTSSLAVVLSLKKMCQLGMTSIMVIHQPRYSLFTLFDDVLLLGRGGYTVYLGPAGVCRDYFTGLGFQMPSEENPADWFMDVLSGEVSNDQIEGFSPGKLPEVWEEVGRQRILEMTSSQAVMGFGRGRATTAKDDHYVLERKLEEEWDRIDRNKDGVLSEEELKELLANCSAMQPDPTVVRELFTRMAKFDCKHVTRKEFVDYLCSLKKDVAEDQVLAALDQEGATGPHSRRHVEDGPQTALTIAESSSGSGSSSDGESSHGSNSYDTASESNRRSYWRSKIHDKLAPFKRQTPGFCRQTYIISQRLLIQWWRKGPKRALFLGIIALGAIVLACIDRFVTEAALWDAGTYLNTHTALALLVAIFCLQLFSENRPFFWRERARGLSVAAYYLTKITLSVIDLILQMWCFTTLYYIIRQPEVNFNGYVVPFMLVTYVASGWGYFISTILPPMHGPFITSLVMFVVCGLLGNPVTLNMFLVGGVPEAVVGMISISRWSVMMSFDLDVEVTNPKPTDPTQQSMLSLQKLVYSKGHWGDLTYWWTGVWALLLMGTALRVLGFCGLLLVNRSQTV